MEILVESHPYLHTNNIPLWQTWSFATRRLLSHYLLTLTT